MKTLVALFFSATTAFAINANADPLMDIIHPESADIFQYEGGVISTRDVVYIEDTGKQVWSVEYEEYVNPADFNSSAKQTLASALAELEKNPPAAGKLNKSTFIWDEVADEYQLK